VLTSTSTLCYHSLPKTPLLIVYNARRPSRRSRSVVKMASQPEDGKHGIPLINVTMPLIDTQTNELLSANLNDGNRSRASSATTFVSETDRAQAFSFGFGGRDRKGQPA
jgi:hypothetical protein